MTCDNCGEQTNSLTWIEGTMDYRKRETVLALCPVCLELWRRRKKEHEEEGHVKIQHEQDV